MEVDGFWFFCEILNTLFICYAGAEIFFLEKKVSSLYSHACVVAAANGLYLVSRLIPLFPDVFGYILSGLSLVGHTLPLAILMACPVFLILSYLKIHVACASTMPWAIVWTSPIAPLALLLLTDVGSAYEDSSENIIKLDIIMAVFLSCCYQDLCVHHRLIPSADFLRELSRVFVLVLAAFPLLGVAVAVVMLLLTSILEAVGVDPHVLNSGIVYGVFYGPFASVYVVMKARARKRVAALPW